jgi:hypothetical protein
VALGQRLNILAAPSKRTKARLFCRQSKADGPPFWEMSGYFLRPKISFVAKVGVVSKTDEEQPRLFRLIYALVGIIWIYNVAIIVSQREDRVKNNLWALSYAQVQELRKGMENSGVLDSYDFWQSYIGKLRGLGLCKQVSSSDNSCKFPDPYGIHADNLISMIFVREKNGLIVDGGCAYIRKIETTVQCKCSGTSYGHVLPDGNTVCTLR